MKFSGKKKRQKKRKKKQASTRPTRNKRSKHASEMELFAVVRQVMSRQKVAKSQLFFVCTKDLIKQIWLIEEEIMVRPAVPERLYLLPYYETQQAKQQKDRSEQGSLQSCEKYVSHCQFDS